MHCFFILYWTKTSSKQKNGQTNHIVSIFFLRVFGRPLSLYIASGQTVFSVSCKKNSFRHLFIKKYKSFENNDLNMLIIRIKHFISQNEILLGKPDGSFL